MERTVESYSYPVVFEPDDNDTILVTGASLVWH